MDNPETWLMNSFWGQLSLIGALMGIVVWVVYAILTERLVGRRALQSERDEKNRWRDAYEIERTAHHVTSQNLNKTVDTLEVTNKLLKDMRTAQRGGQYESG